METLVPSAIARLLDNEPVAHVGVAWDGIPYVTPISFVWLDESFWFRTMPGRRLDAIVANPNLSCEVSRFDMDTGYWESVIVDGTAIIVEDDPAIDEHIMNAIRSKYRRITKMALDLPPDVLPYEGVIVKVEPASVTGRGSGRGIGGPSLPGRLG
jgi:nitroimidazol reductase NimA-like FMN-containing flavoprotein (pyridoxamine 5'-phosphate oxidase superfamily)